ncbi:MAG: phosphoribosylanthranilate isomerase [Candidatus Margulisiibacteriota bacterium]
MTKIKICGITNFKDALLACRYGADAVGFVFAKSPRRISVKKAAAICSKLPPSISKVGVFVNQNAGMINNAVKKCGLDYVQLHGDESPAFCGKIKAPVIKAFRVGDGFSLPGIKRYKVAAILLDSFSPVLRGGTGKVFDWKVAVRAKRTGLPLILSGGLNADNIAAAIKKVRPRMVDVSSGVESRPGRKSAAKMKKAIAIAKRGCII